MAVVYPEYLWIVVLGFIFAFIYAFGIGANDVANAFASTVASKSLTLKQAIMCAAVFEFAGSVLLGAAVTGTIRSKIFDVDLYDGEEDIVMLGMFTSLMTAIVMLMGATAVGLPVSTTQTVVGTIMGFSVSAKGFSSINKKVVTQIMISWVASPGISGVLAFLFFGFIKVFIHNSEDSFNRGYVFFPVVLTVFIGIDLFFVLYKSVSLNNEDSLSLAWVLPTAFGTGLFCGILWLAVIGPIAKRRISVHMDDLNSSQAAAEETAAKQPEEDTASPSEKGESADKEGVEASSDAAPKEAALEKTDVAVEAPDEVKKSLWAKFEENTYNQDLEKQSFHENKTAEEIWAKADSFDVETEQLFTYVQVFTACANSFAHGSNDVANSISPVSAILLIYQTGELSSKAPVPKWILVYGGLAIVVGLTCYGYKVMRTLGYKLTKLSPSRGACAELAASLYVVSASFLEIPVSSTQSIVGAVIGVGLVGGHKDVSWWFLGKICLGWVIEYTLAVTLSAGMFSMFAYSPSLMCE